MKIYELNLNRSRGDQNLYLTGVDLGLSDAQAVYSSKDKACEVVTRELIKVVRGAFEEDYAVYEEMMGALETVVNAFIAKDREVYVENETAPDFKVMELKRDELAVMYGDTRIDGRDADELGLGKDTWGFDRCRIMNKQDAVMDLNNDWEEELSERGLKIETFADLVTDLAIIEDITGNRYIWER